MDWIERALADIDDKLRAAWQNNRCLSCPLAELSALSAATRQLYSEWRQQEAKAPVVNPNDHWTNYRRTK